MTRFLGLAVIGMALFAGSASANGFPPHGGGWSTIPGHVQLKFDVRLDWGQFGWGKGGFGGHGYGGGGGVTPYQLGPWYQYWPYEAHFQTPAMPMYPYWGAMTLPNGSPVINPGYPGHGAVPSYWQGGQ